MKEFLKKKSTILAIVLILGLYIISINLGNQAVTLGVSQFVQMLMIVPPIFVLIGLMDEWIDKETMIKLMGQNSGIIGILIAFIFGTLAAGPLVASFPMAYVMLKKGARYANVLFFVSIWASAKMPIIFFQITSLGMRFTTLSNITLIIVFLIGSFAIEKLLGQDEINKIIEKAERK